jgi:Tol biopolymer transport system component
VTIYEIGQASGTWFIAEELIEGVTLRERLKGGKVPLSEVLAIATQCADTLDAAHAAGIIHRDIKPENIMIRADGVAKVVDFGLARILEPGPDWALDATQTGSVMGTPRYMSPEQARGRKPDARSDIFSLGAVVFEMIAGRPAFPGATTAEVFAALLVSNPDCTDAAPLHEIVAKTLAKDADARYRTMAEFAADLRRFDLSQPVRTRPPALRRPMAVHTRHTALAGVLASIFGLAGYAWISHRGVPENASLKLVPLTTFAGSKEYPAFSPDGSRIAFSWRPSDTDAHHIYIKPISNGEPVQLTFSSEEDAFPTWSPDGGQIAFCRRTLPADERAPVVSGVYVVPTIGGAARKLADNCEGVSWSPDGKALAVARVPDRSPESGGIDLLSLESGERHGLTRSREDLLPVFAPNGRWIAFIRVLPGRGRGRDLFVISATGGDARQLTFDGEYTTGATWTADSREIVISSPRDRAQGALWRVPLSGGSPRPLSATLRNASNPTISRQGHRLAFNESWSDSNIHLRTGPGFPRAGTPWRFDSPRGVAVSSGADHSPVFSPDGKQFAFTSDRTGNNQIWVSRRDGSEAVQLTSLGIRPAGSPRWSPDGAWIAFDVWEANQSYVYVVSSGGGRPRRVSMEAGQSWNPSWSPDGQWIYFTSRRSGTDEIWRIPITGGSAFQVTHGGSYEGRPSPDGRTVYYRKSTPAGCCALWSVPAEGGREEPVRELERFATIGRSWGVLPGGIYFLARRNEPRPTVRFLSFATRQIVDVVRLEQDPDWNFLGLAMSPDGRSLLNVQIDSEANDLMMIENFR